MKPEPLWQHPGRRSFGGNIYLQTLSPSEKPGQGQKIWEDLESTMPGQELSPIQLPGISGLKWWCDRLQGFRLRAILCVRVPSKHCRSLVLDCYKWNPSEVWTMKFRTSEELWSPVTLSSVQGWIFTHHQKGKDRSRHFCKNGIELPERTELLHHRDNSVSLSCPTQGLDRPMAGAQSTITRVCGSQPPSLLSAQTLLTARGAAPLPSFWSRASLTTGFDQ